VLFRSPSAITTPNGVTYQFINANLQWWGKKGSVVNCQLKTINNDVTYGMNVHVLTQANTDEKDKFSGEAICKLNPQWRANLYMQFNIVGTPLWSSGQSSCLQIQRSRVRLQALPNFLSSASGTGYTQPRRDN
jgi:hypothetical protein